MAAVTLGTQSTDFTLDVVGRYVCNTFGEARDSQDRSLSSDARPFDFIIAGGGTFGSVLASHLLNRDKTRSHRILVLEAGKMLFTEHVQNQPMLTSDEAWGVPWSSDSPQPQDRYPSSPQNRAVGLAYCVGGRSLFWGGWSPYFIDSELPSSQWPASVKNDLTQNVLTVGTRQLSYLDDAARQIGSDITADFISGPMHTALRDRLFTGLRAATPDPQIAFLGQRGTPMTATAPPDDLKKELEAPLAVQAQGTRAGFFPFNKFSATQLLIRASRQAQAEAVQSSSGASDVKKRLMVVDSARLIRLERVGRRITRVVTNQGTLDVPSKSAGDPLDGQVFLGLGTIENTRLALTNLPNQGGLIGRNLMAHLRSNLTIRVKRASFGAALDPLANPELQVSALFVKGVFSHSDGTPGHFHCQITASGTGAMGADSEAELFKKIPDIDSLDKFLGQTDDWIVVTIRGIGEMVGDKTGADPANRIGLAAPFDYYDFGVSRALVRLDSGPVGSKNMNLWTAMDKASEQIALIFAGGDASQVQYLAGGVWQNTPPPREARRDSLSSTHHEGGTLWMGAPGTSVTDERGRFHETDNLYALGPCLLPTLGSPNPMLSGVALARRTADLLVPPPALPALEAGFTWLFDGTEKTWGLWQTVGQGAFALVDGTIVAQPGSDLGALLYGARAFGDFTLRLQLRVTSASDNSGVFVRSRDPRRPVPDKVDPTTTYAYGNQAYVPVDTGFEVQIDETAKGDPGKGIPDGLDFHRTGAIYNIPIGPAAGQQQYSKGPALVPDAWNDCEITVTGQTFTVRINGQQTTTFVNGDSTRGKSPQVDAASGYLALQSHTGRVAFRRIRIQEAAGLFPHPGPPGMGAPRAAETEHERY